MQCMLIYVQCMLIYVQCILIICRPTEYLISQIFIQFDIQHIKILKYHPQLSHMDSFVFEFRLVHCSKQGCKSNIKYRQAHNIDLEEMACDEISHLIYAICKGTLVCCAERVLTTNAADDILIFFLYFFREYMYNT